ncbi:MAG: hypothetical protein LLF92_03415 [Planctomycetaceae bacterium]|nr:hypothetical protein [Planctomycetaceae bacterium]
MNAEVLNKHFNRLKQLYPSLSLIKKINGECSITGNISFTVKHDGKVVRDDYDIEIMIPDDYPLCPPKVIETNDKILRCPDNHINDDGTFCFGAPLAVKQTFVQKRDLLWFVQEQIVRFLFNHSYKRDYGIRPDGELSHGPEGLLEYYYELFQTQDNITVLEFLRLLSQDRYNDQNLCPCGSGRKIRRCHYRLIKNIRKLYKPEEFQCEFSWIISFLNYKDYFKASLMFSQNSVAPFIQPSR